jgi:hypothetical protein
MAAWRKSTAIATIRDLGLTDYAEQAVQAGHLDLAEVEAAMAEYRQFLLLIWVNRMVTDESFIIPTLRADQIWHEHILDSAAYRDFCMRLVNRHIDHLPGLKRGTPGHDEALAHTRKVHGGFGEGGFVATYLGVEAGSMREGRWDGVFPRTFLSIEGGSDCGGD